MPTNYPSALDTTTQLENNRINTTLSVNDHASQHNNISDALIAIETALGTAPKGTYTDVKTRLNDSVVKTPTAEQVVQPTGDVVAVVVKNSSTQSVANIFEMRNSGGSALLFIDRNGNLSAQGLKIAGTALNSTHLSDAASLAYLASPTFTGAPAAPTPTPSSDNSTKIATTAFVQGAISAATTGAAYVPIGSVMDWPWGSGAIPANSLLPYGQSLAKASYPALNTIAADASGPYPYSSTTLNFNMPDYRGSIGVGKDNMGGTAASRVTSAVSGVDGATLGATGGAQGVTLVTGNLPAHNHGITGTPSLTDGGHSHAVTDPGHALTGDYCGNSGSNGIPNFITGGNPGSSTGTNAQLGDTQTTGISVNSGTTGITASAGSLATSNTGSNTTHQNMQPTVIVNKIMRVLT